MHRAWLGRPLDEPLRARFAHVRALTRLYYAGVLLSASATAPRTIPDTSLAAPTLAELAEATRAGRLKAGTPAAKHVLGKMFVASFLTEVATPGFDLSV
ncbi:MULTISPECIES: hypothetical protein [unclassified Bradyrhizobium]|uniref:hypothetical protein n=1 Tax=Bradyrhizobium sp. USDA 4541 TaxID=2817704 RepID=UPI0020A33AE9|nr:hypothetical protein [Bradyrhizobium sp. USDA 4541]MCP1851272.1 hypothetical protein [Bradyrhizobium sp. USDA 4541]